MKSTPIKNFPACMVVLSSRLSTHSHTLTHNICMYNFLDEMCSPSGIRLCTHSEVHAIVHEFDLFKQSKLIIIN